MVKYSKAAVLFLVLPVLSDLGLLRFQHQLLLARVGEAVQRPASWQQ